MESENDGNRSFRSQPIGSLASGIVRSLPSADSTTRGANETMKNSSPTTRPEERSPPTQAPTGERGFSKDVSLSREVAPAKPNLASNAWPIAVRLWSPPPWLPPTWTIAQPMSVPLREVNTEHRKIMDLMTPTPPKAIAVLINPWLEYYGAKISEQSWQIYFRELGPYPAWAIEDALRTCCQTSEFFPRIASILKAIPERYHELNRWRLLIETAQMAAKWAA